MRNCGDNNFFAPSSQKLFLNRELISDNAGSMFVPGTVFCHIDSRILAPLSCITDLFSFKGMGYINFQVAIKFWIWLRKWLIQYFPADYAYVIY